MILARTFQAMTKSSEQVAKITEAAERAAYQRGWDECAAAINDAAARIKSSVAAEPKVIEPSIKRPVPGGQKRRIPTVKRKKSARVRKGSTEGTVLDAIAEHPGARGSKIAEMLDGKVNKHTVRTVLRRLNIADKIEQRDEGWYLKGAYRQAA